jgi:hypothetical protein
MEEWIKIDKRYSVSSFGNVRNDENGRILKQRTTRGYFIINLYQKTYIVHRLMIPFLDNPNNYKEVDHIDRNKLNNHISNLRMVSSSENSRNKPKKQNASSQYIGVHFCKTTQRWISKCRINNKSYHIGNFKTEIDAGLAYNNFCIQNGLTTANLNII